MSQYEKEAPRGKRAVALQYGAGAGAPVVVASGLGHLAEKIVDVAADHGVPIYEDDSLATVLTQLQLGQEIPEELYRAIVEIYVYFLNFRPDAPHGEPPVPSAPPPETEDETQDEYDDQ